MSRWNRRAGAALWLLAAGLATEGRSSEGSLPEGQQGFSLPVEPQAEVVVPPAWTIPPQTERPETPFRGNWFKKRTIGKNARVVYEEIHKTVELWEEQVTAFLTRYREAPTDIEQRIKQLRVTRDDIAREQAALAQPMPPIQPGSKEPPRIRPVPEQKELGQKLEELIVQLTVMDQVQQRLAEAIKMGDGLAQRGIDREKRAWRAYEEILAAYDDRHAEQLYEEMKAAKEYLDKLLVYLQEQLVPFCRQQVARFNEQLEKSEVLIRSLEMREVFLRGRPAPVEEKPKPVAPVKGFWSRLWEWLSFPFVWLVTQFKKLFGSGSAKS